MMYKNDEDYERDRSTLICLISAGLQFNREILLGVLQQSKWINTQPTVEETVQDSNE